MTSEYGDILFRLATGEEFGTETKVRFRKELDWTCVTHWQQGDGHPQGSHYFHGPRQRNRTHPAHVAMTWDKNQISFFVDGTLVSSGKIPQNALGDRWRLLVGSEGVGHFQGILDELRISRTIRYRGEFTPPREFVSDDQTVLLYHFDANPFGVIFDHSPRQNHVIPPKTDFVLLPGGGSQSNAGESPQSMSPFVSYLSQLESIDLAALPPVRPLARYQDPPPHSPENRSAVRFNGTDSRFVIPNLSLKPESGITFEVWAKVEGFAESQFGSSVLIANATGDPDIPLSLKLHDAGKSWVAYLHPPKPLKTTFLRGSIPSLRETGLPSPWFHLAVVIDKTQMSLFVDGHLVKSGEVKPPLSGSWDISIGGRSRDQMHIGLIDEVRISDTVRYTEDFQPQRDFERDDDTELLLHFDANEEGIIFDHSGNNLHIQLDNIEWVDLAGQDEEVPQ